MKKKFIGKNGPLSLLHGKVYEVVSVERGWYRIYDETGEDYLYPPGFFCDPGQEKNRDESVCEFIEGCIVGEILDVTIIE